VEEYIRDRDGIFSRIEERMQGKDGGEKQRRIRKYAVYQYG